MLSYVILYSSLLSWHIRQSCGYIKISLMLVLVEKHEKATGVTSPFSMASCLKPAILYKILIPSGISPKRSLNSAGQFSGSSPFWLKNALAQRSRPTPEQPDHRASPD
jgi:hypothetical protein